MGHSDMGRAASAEGTSQIGLTQFEKPSWNIKIVQSTKFGKNFFEIFKKNLATRRRDLVSFFSKLATRFRPKGP